MNRRDFLQLASTSICGLTGCSFGDAPIGGAYPRNDLGIPPLFCTAYIDPSIMSQRGQEVEVAKFPLAIVPQANRTIDVQWRDAVKSLNPRILLLAYQVSVEETTVPGPGHDRLRAADSAFISHSDGSVPFSTLRDGRRRRLFDPRSSQWQDAFVEACSIVLHSYPYDGLFLDQCAVFSNMPSDFGEYAEMESGLLSALRRISAAAPRRVIIANSNVNYAMINGHMLENQPIRLLASSGGVNRQPRVNLFQLLVPSDTLSSRVLSGIAVAALRHGYFFGATDSYQKVRWLPVHDEIMAAYNG